MNLLNKVKKRLDIIDEEQDEKIQSYIDEITDKIKSICNRIDYPEELNHLAIKYAKDCYLYYKDKDSSKNENLQVINVTDNGQKVEFKTIENVTKNDIDLDKIIAKNMDEISMYAHMRW